jgi:cell division protein FtsI/penicillin-binding protein 2
MVTPLQITLLYCALANGGWLMRPNIIHHIEDAKGRTSYLEYPQKINQVFSEETSQKMREILKMVVSNEGTARLAALSQYSIAGKTGTSRKTVTINNKTTYDSGLCLSSFIGILSADCPAVCIGVFLDGTTKNLSGGKTAALVFKEIAEKSAAYLRLKPDKLKPMHLAKI